MTTTTYTISSTAGVNFGTYEGVSPAEALLGLHRAAGYGEVTVWLDNDGDLAFCDEESAALLGDISDWIIEEG